MLPISLLRLLLSVTLLISIRRLLAVSWLLLLRWICVVPLAGLMKSPKWHRSVPGHSGKYQTWRRAWSTHEHRGNRVSNILNLLTLTCLQSRQSLTKRDQNIARLFVYLVGNCRH